ncbi:MAG: MarR family transcriptional regulator, partial [Rhizobiales bacterium]|nr:MarR family transcriptional regulator [Hyphomicrobiales bacterium]
MSDRKLMRSSNRSAEIDAPAEKSQRTRRNGRKLLDFGVLESHLGYFIRRAQVWVFQDFIRALARVDIRPAQY